MNDRVNTLLEGRREKMARALGRSLTLPTGHASPLDADARAHLEEEAEDLYWNELEWENVTAEEATEGGPLVQLTFPGLLAFIRGLLLKEAMSDALAPAEPRPEVAEDVVRFLARRVVELEEALAGGEVDEPERLRAELTLTDRLIDHVLYLLHELDEEDVERLEGAQLRG